MPKVKSDKRVAVDAEEKPVAEAAEKKGWGSGGKLFGTETTETTFQGAGFKDRDKALETIALLDGRDVSFQFQIINSMYHRAKVILKRTKDVDKVANLTAAIETFEHWLDDYRAHSRAKENFAYLPLEVVEAFRPVGARHGVAADAFLAAYRAAGGDMKRLRNAKVDGGGGGGGGDGVTWDVERNRRVRVVDERVKREAAAMYEPKGLPTKDHVEMIMWAYSPEPAKVKKAMPLLAEKL